MCRIVLEIVMEGMLSMQTYEWKCSTEAKYKVRFVINSLNIYQHVLVFNTIVKFISSSNPDAFVCSCEICKCNALYPLIKRVNKTSTKQKPKSNRMGLHVMVLVQN